MNVINKTICFRHKMNPRDDGRELKSVSNDTTLHSKESQEEPESSLELSKEDDMRKKSVIVTSDRVKFGPDIYEALEETEVAAHISIPREGWVVVLASFWSIFILDGNIFTFGSLLPDIAKELQTSDPVVALINSIQGALYFFLSPIASALVNRFGFRFIVMGGSLICSFSTLISYFSIGYGVLLTFYGIFFGLGSCLISMATYLVVGFHYEKLKALAFAMVNCGSSAGIITIYPINAYLVGLAGWRSTILLHSGLLSLIFFLAMTYTPTLSLTVMKTEDFPVRRVTLLPDLAVGAGQPTKAHIQPTKAERLLNTVSNSYYPTSAAVVDARLPADIKRASISGIQNLSKLTLVANSSGGPISSRQMKQVNLVLKKAYGPKTTELTFEAHRPKQKGWCTRFCHWEPHIPQSRPLYRDDAFYEGKVTKLKVYKKAFSGISPKARTGLEYQLAVSRAIAVNDLRQKRGIFTIATKRVLASMLDTSLLKRCSFVIFCLSGLLIYLGLLVPYVYIQDKNLRAGINPTHCSLFVSTIGLANALGRLSFGALANFFYKLDPLKIYGFAITLGGISTIVSSVTYDLKYQYFICIMYGFFIASVSSLRSIVLVNLYGLDKLTSATGIYFLFVGVGILISTPVAGLIKDQIDYSMAFYVAGGVIVLGGIILIPVKKISNRENTKILKAGSFYRIRYDMKF